MTGNSGTHGTGWVAQKRLTASKFCVISKMFKLQTESQTWNSRGQTGVEGDGKGGVEAAFNVQDTVKVLQINSVRNSLIGIVDFCDSAWLWVLIEKGKLGFCCRNCNTATGAMQRPRVTIVLNDVGKCGGLLQIFWIVQKGEMIDHVGRNLKVIVDVDGRLAGGIVCLAFACKSEQNDASNDYRKIASRHTWWSDQREWSWHPLATKSAQSYSHFDSAKCWAAFTAMMHWARLLRSPSLWEFCHMMPLGERQPRSRLADPSPDQVWLTPALIKSGSPQPWSSLADPSLDQLRPPITYSRRFSWIKFFDADAWTSLQNLFPDFIPRTGGVRKEFVRAEATGLTLLACCQKFATWRRRVLLSLFFQLKLVVKK